MSEPGKTLGINLAKFSHFRDRDFGSGRKSNLSKVLVTDPGLEFFLLTL